jgi:anti-anti-sigma factor
MLPRCGIRRRMDDFGTRGRYAASMRSITFEYEANNFQYLERVTLDALKDGLYVTVNLDYVPSLDIHDLRLLIGLLRRTRENGGEFALRASRPDVRRKLALTALDRVFTVLGSDAA